jgi:hypothetical protein
MEQAELFHTKKVLVIEMRFNRFQQTIRCSLLRTEGGKAGSRFVTRGSRSADVFCAHSLAFLFAYVSMSAITDELLQG